MGAGAGISITPLSIVLAVAAALTLAGCGGSVTHTSPPVRLTLSAPGPSARVDTGSVTLSGRVSPSGAELLVLGHRVRTTRRGSFSTTVPLSVGTNLIDVLASAPGARPAMEALRVTRYLTTAVPSVTGESPQAAAEDLQAAGLTPRVEGDSNPLAFLLPVSMVICSQSPVAGTSVPPGTTVTLTTGKVCL